MITAQKIEHWITTRLPGCQATVEGDDGRHFQAKVISSDFQGKTTIERHRMVYATLGAHMHSAIHALSLKTLTPEENTHE